MFLSSLFSIEALRISRLSERANMGNDGRVILKISTKGVESAEICADNDDQQTAGHVLLAAVSSEIRCLDAALKGLGVQRKTTDR
jgi:hypothetical protein